MAAGTMTLAESGSGTVRKIVATWTSGDGGEAGTASATTVGVYDGKLIGLTTDPGSTAPTDNYDLEVTDGDHDTLLGAGANRDTANTEHVAEASLGAVAARKLTFLITNAGDAKQGVVILWIR